MRTLLLAHNILCDKSIFATHVDALAPRHRAIAVDLRGHGERAALEGPFTMRDLGEDLIAEADAAGARAVTLVGVSLGAAAAMEAALAHPDRVEALVLMSATARAPTLADEVAQAAFRKVVRVAGLRGPIAREVAKTLFGETFRAERADVVDAWVVRARAMAPRTVDLVMQAWASRPKMHDRLGAIRAPTLIVVGDEDVACPLAHAEELHAGIAGSRVARVARGGHTLPLERPDETLALIDRFVSTVDAGERR